MVETVLVWLGRFLIWGPITLWPFVVIPLIHHIDSHWTPERAYDFKAKWFDRVISYGIPLWGVLFFIGLFLTGGTG